jgi:hypothetical protein
MKATDVTIRGTTDGAMRLWGHRKMKEGRLGYQVTSHTQAVRRTAVVSFAHLCVIFFLMGPPLTAAGRGPWQHARDDGSSAPTSDL